MKKYILILFLLTTSSVSFSAVIDCPSNYPNGRTLKYSDGSMNYPDGRTMRYSDGSMNYPDGRTMRYSDGSMNYPDGRTMRYSNGSMNYPDGRTMRYPNGSLNNPDGSTNHTGSVSAVADIESGQLFVRARQSDSSYRLTLTRNNFTIVFYISNDGGVICDLDGNNPGETVFKISGSKGSATVTKKAGENATEIKNAIEAALN